MDTEERFWNKVDKSFDSECWIWKASKRGNGYGAFKLNDKTCSSHRIAWELTHGKIPSNLLVLHRCNNRCCVNPKHLYLGTHKDNYEDMLIAGNANPVYGGKPSVIGSKCHSAKLNENDIIEIRKLYKSGLGYRKIGKTYGVDHSNIRLIIKGKTWKHVK